MRINALLFLFLLSIQLLNAQPGSLDALDYESYNARFTPFSGGCIPVNLRSMDCPQGKDSDHILDGEWQLAEGADSVSLLNGRWDKPIKAAVPGSIHMALRKARIIPDPYFGRNDSIAEQNSYKTWWYKKEFSAEITPVSRLIFDGIAVKCSVWLNGIYLGDHEGMFGGPSYDVSGILKKKNVLVVKIWPIPREINNTGNFFNGANMSWQKSVVINCVYGWHYSKIPSSGIWRSVKIHQPSEVELDNPFIVTRSTEGQMNLHVPLKSTAAAIRGTLFATIVPDNFPGEPQSFSYPVDCEKSNDTLNFSFRIRNPRLWWPNDLGKQNLYKLKMTFSTDGKSASRNFETTFGIRTITMAPLPEGPRKDKYNWTFVINGHPHFVKGNGWCTNDVLLDLSLERYDRFLSLARQQHIQLMRAWGGGMPETGDFYDLCDRYGIMIMQEWPTAWNSHETQPFEALEETVRLNTIRLRNHASLVMYGGGNESSKPFGKPIDMMGRNSIELDNSRPFHRGEPWGGSKHNYDCWWGKKPLDNNLTMTADFWGEFGIASLPVKESVLKYLPEDEMTKWPPEPGSVFAHHTPMFNNQEDLNRLKQYSGYVLPGETMDNLIAGSQLAQVVAVRHTLERARTRWPECTGALYYKMNDNYPAVSWSCVDWYGAPKALHYFAQDAFSPVAAVVLFEHTDMSDQAVSLPVFLLDDNLDLEKSHWKVVVRAFDSKLQMMKSAEYSGTSNSKMVNKLGDFSLTPVQTNTSPLLVVTEVKANDTVVFRTFYYMNFGKEKGAIYNLPKTELSLKQTRNRVTLRNTGKHPAVCVNIQVPGKADKFTVSDNLFWLDPGEEKSVEVNLFSNLHLEAWNLRK